TLPVILTARYLAFIPFGLYRSVWRYAGARDAAAIVSAVVLSEIVALSFMVLTQNQRDFWPSFFVVDALICVFAVGAARSAGRARVRCGGAGRAGTGSGRLTVGAGRSGRSLMRELRETAGERVVGFVDDNPRLRRRRVHGVSVVGTTKEVPRLLEHVEPDIVLITIPNAPRERLAAVLDACVPDRVS